MTLEELSNLVSAFARVLYVNGQSTDTTVSAANRLGDILGLSVTIAPGWEELLLEAKEHGGTLVSAVEAEPAGVNMDRVASAMRTIEELGDGQLPSSAATDAITAISKKPPAPTWLFALAASAGAVALAVLFGVQHLSASALIFMSAGVGGILRRVLGRYSANIFLQPFSASLLAGVIGALAVRYELSSSLRLVAVCPCMVLVPGPHFLNGMMDLLRGRMDLGTARLIYAALVVVAISTGLLLGLALLGVALPVDPAGRAVPLLLQRFFLDPPAYAALAGGCRHGRPCFEMGGSNTARGHRGDRGVCGLSHRRVDSDASLATYSHAFRSDRICLRCFHDAGCFLVQDGQRPRATY